MQRRLCSTPTWWPSTNETKGLWAKSIRSLWSTACRTNCQRLALKILARGFRLKNQRWDELESSCVSHQRLFFDVYLSWSCLRFLNPKEDSWSCIGGCQNPATVAEESHLIIELFLWFGNPKLTLTYIHYLFYCKPVLRRAQIIYIFNRSFRFI